jgi:ATP-dependent RNA helicase DDX21
MGPTGASRIEIPHEIAKRLATAGISRLTQVQAKTHQPILEGRDVIARSRTGTGKTMAFALPLSQKLAISMEERGERRGRTSCLVILPTRELALQVKREFQMAAGKKISVVAAVGGSALEPLIEQLEMPGAADVVVGTPGRIVECVRGGWLELEGLQHLVVDEADQLLEGGFAEEMNVIVERW